MNGTLADSVARLLASGAELTLEALGGYDAIVKCPLEVARCRFAPEIAHLVFQHGLADDQQSLNFVAELVAFTDHDITFAGVIDSLIRNDQLPSTIADRCFEHTLERIRNRSAAILVRTSALRGALGLVRGTARRRASLKAALLWVDENDNADFLAHVARIAGLLVTQQLDDDLIALLNQLLKIDSARGEAAFELGMCHLGAALSQERPLRIYEELKAAKGRFATAIQLRELRPDATLLHEVVDLLCYCHDLKLPSDIATRVVVISSAVISYQAYINIEKEVLGIEPRHLEMTCWSSLALRLAEWIKSSTEPAWYDAARIIEEELLPLYDASRSVLRRTSTGGLEVMIRPHIVAAVSDNRSQLYLLRHWLGIHGLAELGQNAADIITAVERALVDDGAPSHPDAAGAVAATAPAILDAAPITSTQRQKILTQVLAGTLAIAVQQASPKIEECLEHARSVFSSIPDFSAATRSDTFLASSSISFRT